MQRVRRILATAVLMVTSVVSVMPSKPALASDVPATPDPVVVGTVTATSAAVTWAPPASDGGSAITSYELYVSGTRVAKIPNLFYTIGGLTGGATYNITLKACNLVGCSPETDAVSVVTMPSAATGLKAVVGSQSLTMTWTDSTSPDVTTHSIWYRPSSTLSWTEWTPGEEDASGTTITGLTNGTTYAVRVRVVAPQGVTDTATVLATPMAAPAAPALSYSNVSQSSLVLAWTMPTVTGATPTYYEVYRDGTRVSTTTSRYFSATGLTPLQTYSFTVKACNSTGCSPASLASTVTLPPPPPSRQAAAAVDSKIVVTWLNSPVADYHSVWYKLSSETTWTEWTPGAADSSPTELTGLPGGVTYNIRIGAHGTDGQAAYSPIVNVVPFAAPSAPYSLRQLVAGSSNASVTWIAPSNGGTPITGYKVFLDGGLYSEPAATATSVAFSNLEIGARYVVTIQACNLIGCSPASVALPIFTVPVGPTAVAVTVGPTTAAVTWTASTSTFVTGYKIFFRRTGTSTWVEFTPQSDDPSGTVVSSLLVSTPYELYVRAYNPRGFADSPVTTFNTQGYQVPTEPTGLSAVATSGGARLSWTAPSWNGAAAITDYRIEWSSDNGSTWTTVQRAASNLTTATVTGLTAGVSYRFRVSAKNVAGFSNPSAPSAPVAPFSTPSAPLALAVTVGDKEMTLTWTAPADNGSSAISDYVIQYSSNNGTYWSVFSDGTSSATTTLVTGLTNGTSYVFRVAAVNSAGQGLWSASSTAAVPVTAPSAPTRVTVFPSSSSVRVAWAVPASNGGTTITDYTVQYSLDDGTTWTTAQDGVSNLTSATVTGLTNGAVYVFRVAAVNSFGSGPWSEVSLPASPRSPADPPTNVTGIALDGKISLSWTAPVSSGGTPVVDYQVSISSNNGGTWRVVSDLSNPTTTALITGLTNGVPYLFKVAAVTSAGPGALSAASAALTPRGAPSAPQLVVGRLGDRQAPLTWQAPLSDGGTPITDYVVQYSSDDGTNWVTFDDGIGTSTAITVTGLTNGLTYIFRVKASNAASPGPFSLNSSPLLLLSISQPPRNLAGTPGAGSVVLTWETPEDDGGSAINDYSVLYSSNGGKTWTSFAHTFSTDTNITVTGLTNGTAYSFKVAAMTSVGAGVYTTLSGTVTPRTIPGVPTALSGVFGNKSAVLSWTAPASNGGNAISDYLIQYSSDGGSTWTTFTKANPSAQTTATVTGLTNGTTYVFRIAAQNAAGAGAWTDASDPVLPRAPATKPQNATGSWGDRSVDLAWDTPEEDGGAPITDYTVQFSTNGTTWTTFTDGVSAGLSATVTGLTNGTAYYFRVAGVTIYGTGVWSSTVGPLTPRAAPGAPTGVTGAYGDTQVTLSWTASTFISGSVTTDYVVEYSSDSGSSWTVFSEAVSSATNATVTGLTNGTDYLFRVAAINAIGQGAWSAASASVTPKTNPGTPSGVVGTYGNASVALSWTAPADDGGSAVTDYSVQFSSNGGSTWSTFTHAASAASSITVTGLTNGTSYVFRVAAVNVVGAGSWSSASAAVVPHTVPGAPTSVAGTFGNTQVTLTWNAPSSNGGAVIDDYSVQFSSNGGSSWSDFEDGTTSATGATVTGLTNGTSYVFRVAAVNDAGRGSWSSNSTSVIPRTTPAAPTSVSSTYGNTTVALAWTAPSDTGGAVISNYLIQYSSDAGSSWTSFTRAASASTSATVTGLTNGTEYVFRVAAVNSVGNGTWSDPSPGATPRTVPGVPRTLLGVEDVNQVALSWDVPLSDGGATVTDYRVQYSSNNGSTWTTFSDGVSTDTSATVTGLTNGTAYKFRVAAVNSEGTGSYTAASASYTPRSLPDAPTDLTATPGNTQVSITWVAPLDDGGSAISDYVIQYSTNGTTWTTFSDGVSTNTSATVTGLTNGTTYTLRVAAKNSAGAGATVSVSATPRTVPQAPASLAASADYRSADLTWSAPSSNGGNAITDYVVQFSDDGGSTWTTFSDGVSSSLTASVTGLAANVAYQFRVAAVNAAGTGTWSSTATATPTATLSGPDNVSATPGDSLASLTWTAPYVPGDTTLLDYTIQYSSDSGSTWTTFSRAASTSASATVTGLANGTSYVFRVASVNSEGAGSWSATTTSVLVHAAPGAPTAVTPVYGNAQVTLSWTAPSSNGGMAISDYVIQYSSNSGTSWTTFSDGTSTSTSATVTGLTNGTSYVFRVAAENSVGAGTWSSTSASVLPHTTPGAPTSLALTYGNTLVALSWAAPASNGGLAVTNYVIQYSSNSGSTWTTFSRAASTSTSATVTGLTNGTPYAFRVAAVNDAQGDWSATSASATPRTTPNAPTGLSAAYGNAQASLSWTASSDNGGAEITDYAIQYSSNSGSTWTTFSRAASTSTSATVTGLTNGTWYVFRVGGVNSEGTGTWSATSASVLVHTTPGAPTAVAGAYGDGQITVSWTAPASNGGLAITDYVLDVSTDGGSSWATFSDGTSTSTSVLLTGLTNGTAYVFRVAAVNDAQGDWSATSAAATPRTTPGAPTGVTPTYGNAQASLTWTAPSSNGGAAITDYTIQFSSNSGSTWSTFSDGTSTSTSTIVTGLTNGTSYVFRVAAVNSEGTGTWSATSASVLVRTSPGAPTAVTPTYGNTQVSLSWTAPASNGGLAITDYVVQYSSNSGSTWTTFSDGTSTNTSAIVTGLTNGTSYVFRVAAVNDAQGSYSATSAASIPRTTPNTPSGLSATPGNAQASLSWTASSDNGGAVITDYIIQYSSNGGSTWTTFADGTSTTAAATVTGLANGTAYVFRVAAVNSEGTGGYTPNASATPRTVPGAPGNISASIPNNTYVAVSFTAPASDGGSAITGYTATCAGSNGTNPSATGTGSPLNVTISNSGINYTCTVKANNAAGSSAASAAKTLTNNYVNPVYYCNSGDNPSGSSSSAFTCTVWTNHPYWVSTIYAPSCSLGGWTYTIPDNSGTYYYRLYTGNFYTSPYDGGSIVNTYRYWATSSAAGCGGQVTEWRWASNSCFSTSSGGTTGTCGATRQYRRIAGGTRSSSPNCHNGGPYGGNGWCYPNYNWATGAWDTGYYADNWYWDNAYTSPLRAAGYWNGWSIT